MDKSIIKDTLISYTGRINKGRTNAPSQYKDRQRQLYADETRLFAEQYDRFSSDYVEAKVQGLNPLKPFEYTDVHLRFSNMITGASALVTVFDNYKMVEIAESQYNYIRRGAKVITMGNVWMSINPDNMSGVQGHTVLQRCDSTWNYLDFYGNIMHEPVCVDRLDMRGVDPDSQRSTMINTGYYNIKVQNNEQTKQLGNNSRLYIGNTCFYIAGYAEMSREFTYEEDSVGMLIFRAMVEEPNMAIDDLDHYVANGKTFSWTITIAGISTIKAGEETILTASSTRTAEEHTAVVEDTPEHHIAYQWESSDEDVAIVDAFGNVEGVSEGTATITCYLEQNPDISATFDITVSGVSTEPHVSFTSTLPERLRMFETVPISVNYYENGEVVPDAEITFTFSGAEEGSYTATVNGNIASIKCWSGSIEPLHITAECNGCGVGAFIELEGI